MNMCWVRERSSLSRRRRARIPGCQSPLRVENVFTSCAVIVVEGHAPPPVHDRYNIISRRRARERRLKSSFVSAQRVNSRECVNVINAAQKGVFFHIFLFRLIYNVVTRIKSLYGVLPGFLSHTV